MQIRVMSQIEYLRATAVKKAEALLEFLYGDDFKTRRTLAVCAMAMAIAFILQSAAPMLCSL